MIRLTPHEPFGLWGDFFLQSFRENMDLEKAYMQGRFDAIPYIDWGDGERVDCPEAEIVINQMPSHELEWLVGRFFVFFHDGLLARNLK